MKSSIQATIGVVVLSLAAACGGGAEDSSATGDKATVSEVALYHGADRQEYLEACAAKEGNAITHYSVLQPKVLDLMVAQFEKKYPKIKLSATYGSGTNTSQLIVHEAEGGANKVDAVSAPWSSFTSLTDYFTKFYSPELKAYRAEDITSGGKLAPSSKTVFGLIYNSDLIDESEVPKTADELLDARWKGKLTISSDTVGRQFIGVMKHLQGDGVVEELLKLGPKMQDVQSSGIATLVAAGEAPMSIPNPIGNTIALQKEGAPVKWSPAAAFWSSQMVGIAAKAKHPCGGMLLVDFILSKEWQYTLIDSSQVSSRTDVDSSSLRELMGLTEAEFNPVDDKSLVSASEYGKLYQEWGNDIDRLVAGK